jgi:hypothetical protein
VVELEGEGFPNILRPCDKTPEKMLLRTDDNKKTRIAKEVIANQIGYSAMISAAAKLGLVSGLAINPLMVVVGGLALYAVPKILTGIADSVLQRAKCNSKI